MSNRIEKLNSEFRKLISEILTKKVKDPRITEMFSVMEVSCDKELSFARVFISIFSTDNEKAKNTFDAICSSSGYVRQQLSRNMHIRTVPQLTFVLDTTMAHSQKINELINDIKATETEN
ncbi:MAG: 30S ribosome-binding factor RbfA [Clostridia bacterium]